MPAAGSEHPPQPQVPMAVGRNLLTLDPQRALGSARLDTQGLTSPHHRTMEEPACPMPTLWACPEQWRPVEARRHHPGRRRPRRRHNPGPVGRLPRRLGHLRKRPWEKSSMRTYHSETPTGRIIPAQGRRAPSAALGTPPPNIFSPLPVGRGEGQGEGLPQFTKL